MQSFFADLIEKAWVRDADHAKGRFRTFLKVAFRRHLARRRAAAGALKRGGGRAVLTLTPPDAAARYAREPAHGETPEVLFDRRWAVDLLARVLDRLAAEHAADGTPAGDRRAARFAALVPHLTGPGRPHAIVAAELGMTEAAAKVAAHRLRNRYRELLRAEVADTVATPADIADELAALRAGLSA